MLFLAANVLAVPLAIQPDGLPDPAQTPEPVSLVANLSAPQPSVGPEPNSDKQAFWPTQGVSKEEALRRAVQADASSISLVSRTFAQTTPCNLAENYQLQYLDRHYVSCSANSALSQFTFQRCSFPNFNYRYTCVTPPKTGTVRQTQTGCNDVVGRPLEYLDRHRVQCNSNEYLSQFTVRYCPTAARGMNFRYSCVDAGETLRTVTKETPCNDWQSRPLQYLDRHNPSCASVSPTSAMQSFYTTWSGCPARYQKYVYTCTLPPPSPPPPPPSPPPPPPPAPPCVDDNAALVALSRTYGYSAEDGYFFKCTDAYIKPFCGMGLVKNICCAACPGTPCFGAPSLGMYSGGYAGGDSKTYLLEDAKDACVKNPACKAVTCAGGGTTVCTLRSTTALYKSPSGETTHVKTC